MAHKSPDQPNVQQYYGAPTGTTIMNNRSSAIPLPTPRIPSVQRSYSQSSDLPMQSPKTPNLSNFMDFAELRNVTEENTESALKAIDLYANTIMSKNLDSPPDLFSSFPTSLMENREYNPSMQQYDNSSYNQFDSPTTNYSQLTSTFTGDNGMLGQSDKRTQGGGETNPKKSNKTHTHKNLPMKTLRKHQLSLDPNERQLLEELVAGVIKDGVGGGVIDSGSSTDENSDSPYSTDVSDVPLYVTQDGQIYTLPDGTQYPQSQLKVAAKHMKNLPPRFQRRLKASGDEGEGNDGYLPADNTSVVGSAVDKNKKSNHKSRYLLDGMDKYADDNVDPDNSASIESSTAPVSGVPLNSSTVSTPEYGHSDPYASPMLTRQMQKTNEISSHVPQIYSNSSMTGCEDLEKDILIQRLPATSQRPPGYYMEADSKKTSFSIDAPEFVPRSTSSPGQSQVPVAGVQSIPYPLNKSDLLNASRRVTMRSNSPYLQSHPIDRLSPHLLNHAAQLAAAQGRSSPIAPFLIPRNSPVPMPDQHPSSSPNLTTQQQAFMLQQKLQAGHKIPVAVPIPAYTSPYAKLQHHPYAINPAAATVQPFHHYRQMGYLQPRIPQHYLAAMQAIQQSRTASPKLNFLQQQQRAYLQRERPSTDEQAKEFVKAAVDKSQRIMVLLRGYPGSGKSHLAKILKLDGVILCADDFFMTDGKYKFDFGKLGEAHEWNQKRALAAATEGLNPIIVDNTNSQMWEMKVYAKLAFKHGYFVEVMEPNTPWKYDVKELAKKNIHSITEAQILKMKDRYEHNISGLTLLQKYGPEQFGEDIESEIKKPKKRRRRRKRGRGRSKKKEKENEENNSSHSEDESGGEGEKENTSESSINITSADTSLIKSPPLPSLSEQQSESTTTDRSDVKSLIQDEDDSDADEVTKINQVAMKDKSEALEYSHHHSSSFSNHQRSLDVYDLEAKELSKTFFRSMSLPGADNEQRDDMEYWNSESPDTYKLNAVHTNLIGNQHDLRLRSQVSWTGGEQDYMVKSRKERRLKTQESKQDNWLNDNVSTQTISPQDANSNSNTPHSSPLAHLNQMPPKRHRHDTFPSVQLNHDVKQMLMTRNWHIPLQEFTRVKVTTMAQDGDFYYVQNALNEANNEQKVRELGFIKVLDADSSRFKPSTNMPSKSKPSGLVTYIDKSTRTDDLLITSLAESIQFLKSCFPEVNETDLVDVLVLCDENLEWAMEMLLGTTHDGEIVTIPTEYLPKDKLTSELEDVPSLMSLSHSCLYGNDKLLDKYNAEKIANISVDRISFINDFVNEKTRTFSKDSESDQSVKLIKDDNLQLPLDKADDIVFKINSHCIQQLTKLFGNNEHAAGNDWVRLNEHTARLLYECWVQTANEKDQLDQIEKDRELACKLQAELKENPSSKTSEHVVENFPPLPGEKKARVRTDSDKQNSIATNIKRQQLQQRFPEIEADTLEEIFIQCGYNYDNTIQCLMPSSVQQRDMFSPNKSDKFSATDELNKKSNSLQSNMSVIKKIQYECCQKAHNAYRNGMQSVASFYSQQAILHADKLKQLSEKRVDAIFQRKKKECKNTNTVDLHGLTVLEALEIVKKIIYYRKAEIQSGNNSVGANINFVTGTGKRSTGGIAKIKPAVINYLNSKSIGYTEPRKGLLKVNAMSAPNITDED